MYIDALAGLCVAVILAVCGLELPAAFGPRLGVIYIIYYI